MAVKSYGIEKRTSKKAVSAPQRPSASAITKPRTGTASRGKSGVHTMPRRSPVATTPGFRGGTDKRMKTKIY